LSAAVFEALRLVTAVAGQQLEAAVGLRNSGWHGCCHAVFLMPVCCWCSALLVVVQLLLLLLAVACGGMRRFWPWLGGSI